MVSTRTNERIPNLRARRSGFTLIELLSSMAILVLIVMLLSRVFTESTNIWQLGTKRVIAATEGRVIMDFLVREMSMAIADPIVSFKLNSDQDVFYVDPNISGTWSIYGAQSDEVCFVAMMRPGSGDWRRTANQFIYFVAPMLDAERNIMPYRYRLVRTRRTTTVYNTLENRELGPYGRPPMATGNLLWWQHMEPDWEETFNPALRGLETIAENVAAFEVWAWGEQANDYQFSYDSTQEGNVLPLWVDIYIELLSEDEAERAAAIWPVNEDEAKRLVENSVRRFTARVFFPNRERTLVF